MHDDSLHVFLIFPFLSSHLGGGRQEVRIMDEVLTPLPVATSLLFNQVLNIFKHLKFLNKVLFLQQ